MCCSMKIQNKSPHKYINYSLVSYYLSFISDQEFIEKNQEIQVLMLPLFLFLALSFVIT